MDRLQIINPVTKRNNIVGQFQGINVTETVADSEFAEMRNLSSDEYPAASCRKPRSAEKQTIEKPHGMYYKNGLCYVDGTKLYYEGELIADSLSDTDKIMCGIGSYIVIFPDKKIFDTVSKTLESIEYTFSQSASATIAPTSDGSTYTKITTTGIGSGFKVGDGVEIKGITANTTSGEDVLNGFKVIQAVTADSITVIGQISAQQSQETGITVTRTAPDMDYLCEYDNRLYGCSSEHHEIYACKLGDPKNWNTFEGSSTDSYAVTVGSDGDFTGCIAFMGYVLFFKEESIIKIYGTKPSNFQLTTYPYRGVAEGCNKTLTIVNETLYYASRSSVMRYDGAVPESISDKLGGLHNEAGTAEYFEDKLYISLKDKEAGNRLFVYDTRYQTWHEEDDLMMEYAVHGKRDMLYITKSLLKNDPTYKMYSIKDPEGTERVNWYAISGKQVDGSMNRKRISKLQMMVDAPKGTLFEIFISYDGSPLWERVYTKDDHSRSGEEININPRKCNYFRYKIKGIGDFKLLGISKTVQIVGTR